MKRLFQIFAVVALLVILFFEYRSYQRHRAETAYEYAVDSTINWEHPNHKMVSDYLFSAEQVGQYGRYAWAKHSVDVLTDNPTDPESSELIRQYQHLVAATQYLEQQLKLPASVDVTTTDMPKSGNTQVDMLLDNPILAKPSDRGALVFEIQKKLKLRGIDLPVDGIYRIETTNGVKQFQQSANLYPSGIMDRLTLMHLFDHSFTP